MDTFGVRLEMAIESWGANKTAIEDSCLALQRNSPAFIEWNRRLMKTGLVEFDEYEEIL